MTKDSFACNLFSALKYILKSIPTRFLYILICKCFKIGIIFAKYALSIN